MQLKVILNSIEKYKGFIYSDIGWDGNEKGKSLLIKVKPRKGSKGFCSGCGKRGSCYDTGKARRFQYVPLWGITVFLIYAMRRINCKTCSAPTVEMVPWADGKKQITKSFEWFLADWAKKLCWKEVADSFNSSWDTVFRAVEMAVEWGRLRMDLTAISSIGVDEIQWQCGHKYLTLVYQIDSHCKRLLWIGEARTEATIRSFFDWFTPERSACLRFIASDMWKPYLKVIAEQASTAVHVLDRFHIMAHINKAINEVRADEARKMKERGLEPVLKNSRWCWLKRPENLTPNQDTLLNGLLKMNLKTVKSYILKEDFQNFWTYKSPAWAGRFLDDWCNGTMRSRIDPIKKVAKMLRRHRPLLLNWFVAKGTISSGVVEGLNNKVKLVTRKAYGFKSPRTIKAALYHNLGGLPEPKLTHRFC